MLRFWDRLGAYRSHPLVGDVRGVGLLGGVEFTAAKGTNAQFDKKAGVGSFCAERCVHYGLITRTIGDIIPFCPPLVITNEEIDEMFNRFDSALADTLAMAQQKKLI
jgi:4-aminobutyrate--pyruvate transaminase